MTNKLTATMQIAERMYLLAEDQNDAARLLGAYRALAVTSYFLGDFEIALQYARHGIQIWHSGSVGSLVEEPLAPTVACLSYGALSEWHLGEITSYQASMAEAASMAKELNDMHALGAALFFATILSACERNPVEAERLASDVIELSTRKNFANWLPGGTVVRGWALAVSGDAAQGLSSIQNGIKDWRATGSMLLLPFWLALRAEALHLANRTSEALESIREADRLIERSEERWLSAELHRLRGAFLADIGADETQIEASFRQAISTAKHQKSISLEKRAEASYAEYRRQKASGSAGRDFPLPLE